MLCIDPTGVSSTCRGSLRPDMSNSCIWGLAFLPLGTDGCYNLSEVCVDRFSAGGWTVIWREGPRPDAFGKSQADLRLAEFVAPVSRMLPVQKGREDPTQSVRDFAVRNICRGHTDRHTSNLTHTSFSLQPTTTPGAVVVLLSPRDNRAGWQGVKH